MKVREEFYVSLKGKRYPTYPGVLIAALESGLKSLRTTIQQVPTAENGQMAVVTAIAEFEDGRIFEDVGDASPLNCSPGIAAAALRMASTRAKGRVLRDGIGLGETLREELSDDENGNGPPPAARPAPPERPRPAPVRTDDDDATSVCVVAGCGALLNKNQTLLSKSKFGKPLCPEHQKGEPPRVVPDGPTSS